MKIIGIIAEYNPFHNGHIHHLKEIKRIYPESIIILVLNGYFTQRGDISILTKREKTKIALEYGINIVIELPYLYGGQSADTFANESIKLLNKLKVDTIVFGSECNDVNKLYQISKYDIEIEKDIRIFLKEGMNYPTALAKAIDKDFTYLPNDLLGISYIKAILKNNFRIEPITIKRTSDYHDLTSNNFIISASNIRNKLLNNIDISNYLPKQLINNLVITNYDEYFKLLKYKIITSKDLSIYLDVCEGIEYRLKKYIVSCNNIDEYISKIKTKRYTYNRINRMFIHILVGIKKSDNYINSDYLRILGFDKIGKNYLSKLNIKENYKNTSIYDIELRTSLLYDLINDTCTYKDEIKNKPVIKN